MTTTRSQRVVDAIELHAIGIPANDAADAAGLPGEGPAIERAWIGIQQFYRDLAALLGVRNDESGDRE